MTDLMSLGLGILCRVFGSALRRKPLRSPSILTIMIALFLSLSDTELIRLGWASAVNLSCKII